MQNIVQQFLNTQNPKAVPTPRLPQVTAASLYLSLNGAKLCYTFFSHELRKIKEM